MCVTAHLCSPCMYVHVCVCVCVCVRVCMHVCICACTCASCSQACALMPCHMMMPTQMHKCIHACSIFRECGFVSVYMCIGHADLSHRLGCLHPLHSEFEFASVSHVREREMIMIHDHDREYWRYVMTASEGNILCTCSLHSLLGMKR